MRPSIPSCDWRSIGGGLAVAAMLLLASPGVKVVRAEEGPQSRLPEAEAPACSERTDREVAAFEATMAEVQRLAAAEAAAPASGDGPIALNNRGYNYGPPPGGELSEIMREVATR